MMNIEVINNVIRFDDVFEGQFFISSGAIYLKTETMIDEDEIEYNAVNTINGTLCYFNYDTIIAKVLKGEYKVNFD